MTVFVPPVMPGATPALIPEAMPAPVTGTTPEAKPATVPEAKPATLPEVKPPTMQEAKPAPVPEAKPTTPPEAKPATTQEAKPVTMPEAKPATTQEAKPVTMPEAKPVTMPEVKPATTQEAKPVTMPEAKPATTQEAKPATMPEAKPATTQEAKPATMPEVKPATTQEAKPATMPEAAPSPMPEAMPAPTAVVDVDAPIAEQLRNLANGKFDRFIGNKKERASIEAFYVGRNYAPLWITDGNVNARATAAIAYLNQVGADGLDPADYPVPNFASLSDPAALAEAEIRLTTSVITYAHHAQIGRIHWSRVSADIFYDTKAPDPAAVLANMVEAKDVGEALASYEPHAPEYLALKARLAETRAGRGSTGKARISNGPSLNIGMQDPRVPLLRLRLGIPGGAGAIYDRVLAEAVMRFQQEHALSVTGTLNAATVEALNGRQSDTRTDIILANMERWRWMPHNLGKAYVIVNLPDFTLRVVRQGKQVWMARIVAGKTTTPTPLISAQMKSITVNPIWNVPASITANEYLPLLQQDPTILHRMGLIVSYNPDGTIHIAQPPGEQNALGRLRFNFPNKFLVYQHDSNQKQLFANERRAESHGCMRVQDPLKYAEVLLSLVRPADGFTQDRIHALFGDNEVEIPFPALLPVHVTYQTAFVDDRGQLEFREDVYGHDEALLAIMKGAERRVADIPIERRESVARRQLLAMPDNALNGWGANGRGVGETNIFTRLFGNPYAQPAPVPRSPIAQPRQQPYYQR
jgi:murein L,D-transpeptidase YcbB/YkuD